MARADQVASRRLAGSYVFMSTKVGSLPSVVNYCGGHRFEAGQSLPHEIKIHNNRGTRLHWSARSDMMKLDKLDEEIQRVIEGSRDRRRLIDLR
jgi:hypothetical protein